MKRLGKLVIMTFAEYESLMCRCEDADAHAADFAEELSWAYTKEALAEANRRKERKAAFTAGKFHAAGGYSHALYELRAKYAGTTAVMLRFMDLAAKWRPLVEALETYPNQFVEIAFDQGLHFPVECVDGQGKHYLKSMTVSNQDGPVSTNGCSIDNAGYAASVLAPDIKEKP